MPTYAVLINFTDQGARAIRDTRRRADAFRAAASAAGVTVRQVYWTLGAYDGLLLLEAPDDQAVTALLLDLATLGNVRTQTLRAFGDAEVESILARLPHAAAAAGGNGGGARNGGRAGGSGTARGSRGSRGGRGGGADRR